MHGHHVSGLENSFKHVFRVFVVFFLGDLFRQDFRTSVYGDAHARMVKGVHMVEQAGSQVNLRNAGKWYATMPAAELEAQLAVDQQLQRDWDETYGDRMQKLVFIGQHMDKKAICQALDECLEVY